MASNYYHLAQVNIGRARGPMDTPVMSGFAAQLAPVNAIADQSPGFVWRLQTENGDATSILPYDDPAIMINMSVWESIEALRTFVYRTSHVGVMRDRAQWFEKMAEAYVALWWIPAGHTPSIGEAQERLEFRRAFGDTALAFSFGKTFPAPEAPEGNPAPFTVNLDGRRFFLASNTPNGDCGNETRFEYRQHAQRVWATYRGGSVRFGSLVAINDGQGRLDMRYLHANSNGEVRTGKGIATPEVLPDGSLRLLEEWQWTHGDHSAGSSVAEEITG
jgi:Domain of unknown function (DUF3291)